MRFFEAENAWHEPTLWVDDHPVLSRCNLEPAMREAWPHIVRALTAGPTLESARVVIDTLQAEVKALTAANRDLNAELTGVRRWLTDERNREGCE